MQLSQAIDKLRPEFPQRDCLRRELLQLFTQPGAYFATIPRDICNIIADMVPDLRMSYPAEPFKSTDQLLADFNAKYRGQNRLYDIDKLRRDFPETPMVNNRVSLNVKFINGCPQFFTRTIDKYLGTDRETGVTTIMINIRPDVHIYRISKDLGTCQSNLIYNNKNSLYVPWGFNNDNIFLLPCGLCCVYNRELRTAFVTDIQNNLQIDVNVDMFTEFKSYVALFDDFGQKIEISNDVVVKSLDAVTASEYTTVFLRILI
jgi:hypothetical protein